MIWYSAASLETLTQQLGQELSDAPAGPFVWDLILTRSGGLQRWLTQQLATTLGSSGHGDGVTAGIQFLTLNGFSAHLRPGSSPWSPDALLPRVMNDIESLIDTEGFEQVRAHLVDVDTRPRRRASFARLAATRFSSYATWNLSMTMEWNRGHYVLADGSPVPDSALWQPYLWNRICEEIGSTPEEDRDLLIQNARSQASNYSHIALFCPQQITATDTAVLAALDEVRPVLAFSLVPPASPDPDIDRVFTKSSVHLRCTTTALEEIPSQAITLDEEPTRPTLLSAVQQGLPMAPDFDDSIQIHAGHADRLGEILSDLLIDLLDHDPSLEPRDILVLVDNMDDHRANLEALLSFDDSDDSHPRHRIRASIASGRPSEDSGIDLLRFVITLVRGRATSEDLLRLCGSTAVMARFGFTDLDLDRLATLIQASGIRWGLNPNHREHQAMASFAQNTWMAGLGRMVLGVALSEEDLSYRGTVLPLDAVDSDTVRLVEALGEIVAHIRRCVETWVVPTSPSGWADRFRTTLDVLTLSETTMAMRVIWVFEQLEGVDLSLEEAESCFLEALASQVREPTFLNGSLAVAPLGSMSLVPHRIIILFGLDAESFPQLPRTDGDDLVGFTPQEDPRLRDRQVFYDALISAREKLIAIYCGFDPATAHRRPEPVPVADLLALSDLVVRSTSTNAAKELVTEHSLQSSARIHTYDQVPLAVEVEGTDVEIDDLCDLYTNPAAYWLRRNAGLTPSVLNRQDPLPTSMSLALTALDAWSITNRMIRLLLSGKPADSVLQAELRRGTLPPSQAGVLAGQDCLNQAQGVVHRAKAFTGEPLSWRGIDLTSPSGNLVGNIAVRGETLVEVLAGRVRPRHQISAWIRVLGLQTAYPTTAWTAVLVGSRSTIRLIPPNVDDARRHLDYLWMVGMKGIGSPLPLPDSASAHQARFQARDLRPNTHEVNERLKNLWNQDASWPLIWASPETMASLPAEPDEQQVVRFPTRFETLSHGIYVPMIKAGGIS